MVQRSCSVTRSCATDNHESLKSIARISTGESGCSTTWTRAVMSSGPEIVGLASSPDTLKGHESAVWGAWAGGVLPETRSKTLKQETKTFISPPIQKLIYHDLPGKFYKGRSQEKTHLLRLKVFLLLSPL